MLKFKYIANETVIPRKISLRELRKLYCPHCGNKLHLVRSQKTERISLRCAEYPVCRFNKERNTLEEVAEAVKKDLRFFEALVKTRP